MKQLSIVTAYNSLEALSNIKDYHAKEQWALYSLRKELRPFVDFYEDLWYSLRIKKRIKALASKYSEFTDEKGMLYDQHYLDYAKEKEELDNLEVEQKINKIELPVVDGVTFLTMELLEDFINFIET